MLIKLLLKLLKNKRISQEERGLILNSLVESINGLPVNDIITFDLEGTLKVQGKPVNAQQAISIREGAFALLNNETYKLIKEQIAYNAIKMGIHTSITTDMLLLSKAALWIQQNEIQLLERLSGLTE